MVNHGNIKCFCFPKSRTESIFIIRNKLSDARHSGKIVSPLNVSSSNSCFLIYGPYNMVYNKHIYLPAKPVPWEGLVLWNIQESEILVPPIILSRYMIFVDYSRNHESPLFKSGKMSWNGSIFKTFFCL